MFSYDLEIVKSNSGYSLTYNDRIVCTAVGKIKIIDKPKELLDFIKNDFDRCGEFKINKDNSINFNNQFCAYAIFSDQLTLIENKKKEEYLYNLSNLFLKYDHCLFRTTNGPEEVDQEVRLRPITNKIIKLIGKKDFDILSSYAWGEYYKGMTDGEDPGPGKFISDENFVKSRITENIHKIFTSLNKEQKGAVHGLYSMLGRQSILMPILLISKNINVSEYAQSFIGLDNSFYYIFIDSKNKKEENKRYQEMYERAYAEGSLALNYSECIKEDSLITKDETTTHEYKSSLRVNTRTNQIDNRMVEEVLRAIVAFLNTKGGCLVVGVDDDKNILGLKVDRFQNSDEWQRFLKDKISNQIGDGYLESFIHPKIINQEGKDIAIIQCDVLPTEKTASLNGNIFIRQGPSSKALSPIEAVEWSKIRILKEK